MISQEEMVNYRSLEKKIHAAEKRLKLAVLTLKDRQANFLGRLKQCEAQEPGLLTAKIGYVNGKASLSWKGELEKIKGLAYVEELLQKAPRPKNEILVIEEVKQGIE